MCSCTADPEVPLTKRFNLRALNVDQKLLLVVALQEKIGSREVGKAHSPWAFSVVLAPKKGETARLCADFREINAINLRDSYPCPSVNSTMYLLPCDKTRVHLT